MIQSIAIQSYFAQMRHFFTRQGFDGSMKVVYSGDAEGPQRLLEQDMANKEMDRKQGTDKDTVRSKPYTYLFWTKGSLQNIIRRPVYLQDGFSPDGKARYKKTVSASFPMACTIVSNKANLIEDFSEAFAAEYQNIHNVPVNLKYGYDDKETFNTIGLALTAIQELGKDELVSFHTGNLFAYMWEIIIHFNLVSEFADWKMAPLKNVVVDLYNPKGIPLGSLDYKGNPMWKTHIATDGTEVIVPEKAFFEKDITE